jgi:hypothetical protein
LKKPLAILDSITLESSIKNLGENTKPKCTKIKKTKLQSAKSKIKMQNANPKFLLGLKI